MSKKQGGSGFCRREAPSSEEDGATAPHGCLHRAQASCDCPFSDFFWIARAGFHSVTSLRPTSAKAPKDFLPPEIACHLEHTHFLLGDRDLAHLQDVRAGRGGRSGPGVHDHPAGWAGHGVPAVQPGLRRRRRTRGGGEPGEPGRVPDGVPVGAGVGPGRVAGPVGVVRARGGRVRRRGQDGRRSGRCSRGSTSGTRSSGCWRRPARMGLGWIGWCSIRPGRGSRTRSRGPRTGCPGCTPRRSTSELTDAVKAAGLGVDQPIFHKVIVITDRVVLDRQLQATVAGFEHTPGTIVKIDQDSAAVAGRVGGQHGPGDRHDVAEVPGGRRGGHDGGRAAVRGDRGRGALLDRRVRR